MGQTINSVPDMVSYAGDLRRAAKHEPSHEVAEKIRRSADHLEKTAVARVSDAGHDLGKLLDILT